MLLCDTQLKVEVRDKIHEGEEIFNPFEQVIFVNIYESFSTQNNTAIL